MINILLVTTEKPTGLNYHRQIMPHHHLERYYPGMYHIETTFDIERETDAKLKEFQIISFLRIVSTEGRTEQIINRCKKAGAKIVIDIDDYWLLHKDHPLKPAYAEHKIAEQTIDGLRLADHISTTTWFFSNKIKELNDNVIVFPNAINPDAEQFEVEPTESGRTRFGWIGGVYHIGDLMMIYPTFKELWKTDNSKFQLCLGGYNKSEEYDFIEKIFTDDYKNPRDEDYLKYLSKYTHIMNYEISKDKPYKRMWGRDVFHYAEMYNEIDVALVPLQYNNFNCFKSQLKIIEAGWFKKAVIVSAVNPYLTDCNNKNSILIHPDKHNKGWLPAMKSLILNPNKREDLAEALHEHIKRNYTMDIVNESRNDFYQKIANE